MLLGRAQTTYHFDWYPEELRHERHHPLRPQALEPLDLMAHPAALMQPPRIQLT
jgi:hypothetical protein